MRPLNTRLSVVWSKDPVALKDWVRNLGARIEIKGQPVPWKNKWYLWFVPGDSSSDIESGSID